MSVSNRRRLCAIVPALNEATRIGSVVRKALAVDVVDEVVVVDDGSTDDTAREAREAGATVLTHRVNRGVGAAIRTGIHHAIAEGYQVVTFLGGDDQHDPADVPRVAGPVLRGEMDFVQGSRYLPGGRVIDQGWFRAATTRAYAALLRRASRLDVTDATNGLRAIDVTLFRDPRIDIDQAWLDTYELEPYLLYKAHTLGYRLVEVPITIRYHAASTKMQPVRDWWRILRPYLFLSTGLRR